MLRLVGFLVAVESNICGMLQTSIYAYNMRIIMHIYWASNKGLKRTQRSWAA